MVTTRSVSTDSPRRRAILEAAARAMELNPNFRIFQATDRLEMRKSVVHYYFGSKTELIHAVFHEVPRTPALFLSLLALSLEDSYLREELGKELERQAEVVGRPMTAQAIGQQVMSVLGVRRETEAAE